MASKIKRFLAELKRRRVYHVAVAYVVVGLGVLGAAELILDPLGLEGARTLIVILTLLGFPLAVVVAWAYEVRPEEPTLAEPLGDGPPSSSEPSESVVPADVSTSAQRKSIVVLPFDNMSPDPGDAYFSDGLTEEVITQLSYLRSLRVISRSSAMALKATQKDVCTIGRELDVQFVLEGSVRKAGNSLRITAQLIDARTDEHVWAETFDRELADVFEIQSEIALNVAGALRATLDARGVQRIRSHPTESLDAHDAYLLGWHHVWGGTEEGIRKAEGYFERALELDPDYALAHAGLAYWYVLAGGAAFGLIKTAEAMSRAKVAAQRAIALDPDLGVAHGTLAVVECGYREWERAEDTGRRGVERDPNSSWAWLSYAVVLGVVGRHEECLAAVDRAVELEPLAMMTLGHAAWHYCNAGRMDEALGYARRAEEVDSGFWGAIYVAFVLQCRGEDTEALAHLEQIPEQWDKMRLGMAAWVLAYASGRAGRRAEFEEAVADVERRAAVGTASWTDVALAWMGVGNHERALDDLEKAVDQPLGTFLTTMWLGVIRYFDPIRDDPRFQRVLQRLGLV